MEGIDMSEVGIDEFLVQAVFWEDVAAFLLVVFGVVTHPLGVDSQQRRRHGDREPVTSGTTQNSGLFIGRAGLT